MPRPPQYRIDGAVGMIAAGALALVLGMVASVLALSGDLSGGNGRGWFLALLGIPLGLLLLAFGSRRRMRDRRGR